MTRELEASAVLTAAQLPLVALHRALPEQGLVDLIRCSELVGDPVRLSRFHVVGCPRCGPALLVGDGLPCFRGRPLLAEAHAWRDRSRA